VNDEGFLIYKYSHFLTEKLWGFISMLMCVEPADRYSAAQALAAFSGVGE
jgi:hypothetical protein